MEVQENSDKYLTVRQMLKFLFQLIFLNILSISQYFFKKEQLKYKLPYFINNEWLLEIFTPR